MKERRRNLLWAVSLLVIGMSTVILAWAEIAGAELPDMVRRISGLADLAALLVFGYAMADKLICHKESRNRQE